MKRALCAYGAADKTFGYIRKRDLSPEFIDFNPHTHNGFEIFALLRGDVEFLVEGARYAPRPYDILVMRGDEMHQIFHRQNRDYERIVVNIDRKFFEENRCEAYQKVFLERPPGERNLIRAGRELFEPFWRMERYVREGGKRNTAVVACALVELLHELNRAPALGADEGAQSAFMREALLYINRNLSGDLSLDALAARFFLSKYHLCRVFKRATGFTVSEYVGHKRVLLAKELCRGGKTLAAACAEAGFGDYSSFYKRYLKETGVAPSRGLKV
jgi:AraC-like DNA-binding protein